MRYDISLKSNDTCIVGLHNGFDLQDAVVTERTLTEVYENNREWHYSILVSL